MKTQLNIDNYEEIMFRLLEDDFDEPTRTDLLQQIEKDELFKFEWELWQKTKFQDSLENYTDESRELTDKIILIAELKPAQRKLLFYFLAAASIIVLLGTLFFLNVDFKSGSKQSVIGMLANPQTSGKQANPEVQNVKVNQAPVESKLIQKTNRSDETLPIATDSVFITPVNTTLAEIPPVIDSVPVKTNILAKAPENKPRYIITIETSDIMANGQNNNDMAQNQNGKIKKVFTNTKMLLSRKPNGEPDKIYIIGDENSYVCININY
jgi:hypothetical protein